MRADRLLSLLLLLQTRGPLTAQRLAQELEVSERTVYRDILALGVAGIPVYGEPGPAGGYRLVENYRTSLTGLNESEVRAIAMLHTSAGLEKLGLGGALRSAALKLAAALPILRQAEAEGVRARFYIDTEWWQEADEPVPFLPLLHQAVWEDRLVTISYHLHLTGFERLAAPYGLVAKAGVWRLVSERQGKLEVRRVTDLLDVRLAAEKFVRPPDFDLEKFWLNWCAAQQAQTNAYPVRLKVAPRAQGRLRQVFGSRGRAALENGQPAPDGRLVIELAFSSLEAARDQLLPFGSSIEVLSPAPLRLSMQDAAEQIAQVYMRGEFNKEGDR